MIDTFSIMLSHGLLLVAFWRLLMRADLDREKPGGSDALDRDTSHQDEPPHPPREGTIFPHA